MWREGHYRTFFSQMLNNGIKWTKQLSRDVKDLTPRESRTHTGTSEVYFWFGQNLRLKKLSPQVNVRIDENKSSFWWVFFFPLKRPHHYFHLQLSIISESSSRRSSSSFPGSKSISASNLPPEISHISFSKSSSTESGGFPVEAELSRRGLVATWDEEGPDPSGSKGSEEDWVEGSTKL